MKKSISRKMLLPILLASFCSGASAQSNGLQYGYGSPHPFVNSQTSNQNDSGYSGRTMVLSNLATATVSGAISFLGTGLHMENCYKPIVNDRFELQKEIEELKKSFDLKKTSDLQSLKKAVELANYYKAAFDQMYIDYLSEFNENLKERLENIRKVSKKIMTD